jgi:hypothetical protein
MYIEFDTQYIAIRLCELADPNKKFLSLSNIKEIEKALYHLKTIAENEYNQEYFRTLLKVLKSISTIDYLED